MSKHNVTVNDPDPALSTFFILAILFSIVLVLIVLAVLIWQLGWQVLLVLGAAIAIFVVASLLRDFVTDARAVSRIRTEK